MKRLLSILSVSILAVFVTAGSAMAGPLPEPNLLYSGPYVDMYLKNLPSGLLEEKVYLDNVPGTTVIGHVGSQDGEPRVYFSSSETLTIVGSGWATIKAADGYLNDLTITAPGYWFEDLIFSVNLFPNSVTDFSVTATDKSGGTDTFAGWTAAGTGWGAGENRILLLSQTGDLMQSVTMYSLFGVDSVGGIDQIKQTEISGLTPVPEPSTMLLFGTSLVGLAAFGRKKLLQK